MKKIIWNDSFITGINKIDYQHKILIDKINQLIQCLEIKECQETITSLLNFLEEYFLLHFSTEEHLFKTFNYEKEALHMKEHIYFMEQIYTFKDKLKVENNQVDQEILIFLLIWFKNHILETDMEFVKELKKQKSINQINIADLIAITEDSL